jgi:hypothetical protein
MIAMADALLAESAETGKSRQVVFVHGASNGKVHAFARHMREAAAKAPALKVHVRYSNPDKEDVLGASYDSTGFVDAKLIESLVKPSECDFYLCGPPPFMQSNFDGLVALGVNEDRIHFESFGTATIHKKRMPVEPGDATATPIPVRFAKSGKQVEWANGLTLLELAEANGLAPEFGCRSGICGSCITKITAGSVDYLEEPIAERETGEVLLCCSVPHSSRNPDGEELGVTLAL